MVRRARWLAVALLLLAGAAPAADAPHRPRVGLALSGGSAHGLAHVGVLKVLQELRVPVDYVAGTSMGSIVGGLYATGMPPGEMERILETTDWEDLLDDHYLFGQPQMPFDKLGRQRPCRPKLEDPDTVPRIPH